MTEKNHYGIFPSEKQSSRKLVLNLSEFVKDTHNVPTNLRSSITDLTVPKVRKRSLIIGEGR